MPEGVEKFRRFSVFFYERFFDPPIGNQPHDGDKSVNRAGNRGIPEGSYDANNIDDDRNLALEIPAKRNSNGGIFSMFTKQGKGEDVVSDCRHEEDHTVNRY